MVGNQVLLDYPVSVDQKTKLFITPKASIDGIHYKGLDNPLE